MNQKRQNEINRMLAVIENIVGHDPELATQTPANRMFKILEKLDIKILRTNIANDDLSEFRKVNHELDGYLFYNKTDDEIFIFLNHKKEESILGYNFKPSSRQLFTIAHEIGHYLNIKDREDNFKSDGFIIEQRNLEQEEKEFLANSFAAQLLIPENDLKENLNKYPKDISLDDFDLINLIASYYSVSKETAKIRLESILEN